MANDAADGIQTAYATADHQLLTATHQPTGERRPETLEIGIAPGRALRNEARQPGGSVSGALRRFGRKYTCEDDDR